MRGVALSRRGFGGFLALAFALGLLIGVALLLWQRVLLLDRVKSLETKVAAISAQAADTESRLAEVRESLASTEASMQAVVVQNSQLASDLVATRAALVVAQAAASAATTPVAITDRSTDPASVAAGAAYTVTVRTQGKVVKVTVRVVSTDTSKPYNKSFILSKVSTAGAIDAWQAGLTAPSAAGHYHYYVYAYATASNTPTAKNLTGALTVN